MKVLYAANAIASGGRGGTATTTDGKVKVQMTVPKELGGPGGAGTNPEQLFAFGYSACFLDAIKAAAKQSKTRIAADSTVAASVGIGRRDDGTGFALEVSLQVSLPGLPAHQAEALVSQAHLICPYSHATRGNIAVWLKVV